MSVRLRVCSNLSNIYLASGFHQRYALRGLAEELQKLGHSISSRWIWIDSRPSRANGNWDNFALSTAKNNLDDLQTSDILIVDTDGIRTEGNGGAHTELGFFIALGKPIYLVGKRSNTFHWLSFITQFDSYKKLLEIFTGEFMPKRS